MQRISDLFASDALEDDEVGDLVWAIGDEVLQSAGLQQKAIANSETQFTASAALDVELVNAITDAMDVHQEMTQNAIDSLQWRAGFSDMLLGLGKLDQALRMRGVDGVQASPMNQKMRYRCSN